MLTEDICNRIVSAYAIGSSVKVLANEYGYDVSTIRKVLKRAGVFDRCREMGKSAYAVDVDYFRLIDAPDKSYWLGFIFADGWVVRREGYLSFGVELKESDVGHLEKLARAIGSNRPISTRTRHIWGMDFTMHTLACGIGEFCKNLAEKGIVSSKKDINRTLLSVPIELRKHFWRGMVDGDGYVRCTKRGDWEVGIVGDLATCEAFKGFSSTFQDSQMNVHPQRTIYQFKLQGLYGLRMIRELYGCRGEALDRKVNIVKCILEQP